MLTSGLCRLLWLNLWIKPWYIQLKGRHRKFYRIILSRTNPKWFLILSPLNSPIWREIYVSTRGTGPRPQICLHCITPVRGIWIKNHFILFIVCLGPKMFKLHSRFRWVLGYLIHWSHVKWYAYNFDRKK